MDFAKGVLMSKIRFYIIALLTALVMAFTGCAGDAVQQEEPAADITVSEPVSEPEITSSVSERQTSAATSADSSAAETTTAAATTAVTTTVTTAAAETSATETVPETVTAVPATEATAAATTTAPAQTTHSGPKTYSPDLNPADILTAAYTPESVTLSKYYQDDTVLFINEDYVNGLIEQFNGMKFTKVSDKQLEKEQKAFKKWQRNNPDYTAVAEAITFFDRLGNEYLRFESDLYACINSGESAEPFVRMKFGGSVYEYYTGKVDAKPIQTYGLNQILIKKGLMSVEICQTVALLLLIDDTTYFVDETPEYRLYAPYEEFVGIDGETYLPEDFGSDVRLCDLTFTYLNGDYYVVTMNAATCEIYAAKVVKNS